MSTVKKKRGVGLGLSITRSLSMTSNATRLLPYLVLGGQEVVSDSAMLELFSVTHILNASTEISCAFEDRLSYLRVPVEDKPEADVKQFFGAIRAFLADVKGRHLRGEKACCFVHCKTGMSRSTTTVLAFLISEPGMLREVAAFTSRSHLLQAESTTAAVQPAGSESAATASGGAPAAAAASCAQAASASELDGESSPFMRLRDALAYVRERRPRASPNQGFMAQLLELEASLHADGVSIDIGRYSADRFGDVRACCNGTVHPAVGYTGGAATAGFSAAEDAMLLQTQVQAVVEPSPMPDSDAAVAGAGLPALDAAPSLKAGEVGGNVEARAPEPSGDATVGTGVPVPSLAAPAALRVPAAMQMQAEGQALELSSSGSASGAAFAGFAGPDASAAQTVTGAEIGAQHGSEFCGADSGCVGVCGRGAATTVPASRDDHGVSDASLSAVGPVVVSKSALSGGSPHSPVVPFSSSQAGLGLARGHGDSRNGLGGAPPSLLASLRLPPSFAGGSLTLHFGASQSLPQQPQPHGRLNTGAHDSHFASASTASSVSRPQAGTRARARSRSRSQVRSAAAAGAGAGAAQARRASITSPGGSAAAHADHITSPGGPGGTGIGAGTGAYNLSGSGKLGLHAGDHHSDTGTPSPGPGAASACPSSPASARGSIGGGSSVGSGHLVLSASGSRATAFAAPGAFGSVGSDADSPSLPILCVHGVGSPSSQRRSSVSSSSGYRAPVGRPALASPGSLVAPSFSAGPVGAYGSAYASGVTSLSPGPGPGSSSSGSASAEPFPGPGSLSVTGSAVPLQQQQKPAAAAGVSASVGGAGGPVGVLLVPPPSAGGVTGSAVAAEGRSLRR